MKDEEKNETTTVAVTSRLAKALASVDEALKAVKQASDSPYQTNGKFWWNPGYTKDSASIDIHTTDDLMMLLCIYASVQEKSDSYERAAKECNLDKYPNYTWLSFSWAQWKNDLKTRIALVSNDTVIKKLQADKKILEENLSKDARLERVLEDMGY